MRLSVLHFKDGVEGNLDADREKPLVDVSFESRDDLRGRNERRKTTLNDHGDGDGGRVGSPSGDGLREDVEGDLLTCRVLALGSESDDVVEDVFQLGLVG